MHEISRIVVIYGAGDQRGQYRNEASEICTGLFGQILSWAGTLQDPAEAGHTTTTKQ